MQADRPAFFICSLLAAKQTQSVKFGREMPSGQSSKWAGICWYTIPELLFVPEFKTGTVLHPFIILLLFF
jgi:hypothetical protein